MDDLPATIIWFHRLIGYPTAFIVAPIALATFAGARGHRLAGKTYFVLMTILYITGTYRTLTHHDWYSWDFGRNLTFNFFGYSMVLYGVRAIYLFRRPGDVKPGRLDRFLAGLLIITVVAMLALAIRKNTALRVFSAMGAILIFLELRELRAGFRPKSILYRRHVRYILASYFYVLTVASLVHLYQELPKNVRWLWPTVLGFVVIYLCTAESRPRFLPNRSRATKWAMIGTIIVALGFGGYAMYELILGRMPTPQSRAPAVDQPGTLATREPPVVLSRSRDDRAGESRYHASS